MLGRFGIDHNRSKGALQFDLKGQLIAEYGSQSEAERKTGISNTGISRACAGELKTAGGFIWKFKKAS